MSEKAAWAGMRRLCVLGLAMALAACAGSSPLRISNSEFVGLENAVERHVDVLASDEFAGRRPGTIGERKTLDYLRSEFEKAGFVSGTNDPAHAWFAPVQLASVANQESRIEFQLGRRKVVLTSSEATASTERRRGLVEQSEAIFVGYEAENVSEEDVRGRVVVMLSEPGVSPGRRQILYGKGPAAIVTVVDDESTIAELRSFEMRQRLVLAAETDDELTAFATSAAMARAIGEQTWQSLLDKASDEGSADGFAPVLLDARITIDAETQRRDVRSHNFIGRLPGTRPEAGAVLLLAHWDHFGECGPEDADDRLCNGAVDNASGLGLMIELGKRLAKGKPLGRDIYVLGTTAEEWGLLGAQAFVEEPPIPLQSFVAAFNFDTVAISPRGSPVGFIGEGRTPLDEEILGAIEKSKRGIAPRELTEPFLRRQDGWALLQRDVPAVVVSNAFGDEDRLTNFLANDYHKASDEPGELELGGAVEDLLLHELLVRRIADPEKYP